LEDDRKIVIVSEFGVVKEPEMTMKELKSVISHELNYRVFRPPILQPRGLPMVFDRYFAVDSYINKDRKPDIYLCSRSWLPGAEA
jgi:hypothetical protein